MILEHRFSIVLSPAFLLPDQLSNLSTRSRLLKRGLYLLKKLFIAPEQFMFLIRIIPGNRASSQTGKRTALLICGEL